MSRAARIVLVVGVLGFIVIVTAGALVWVSGGSGEPSRSLADFAAAQAASSGDLYQYPTEAPPEPAIAAITPVPTEEATVPVVDTASAGALFNIVPEESEVRFELDNVRGGQLETVVGRTNQVAGQIFVDFDDPAQTQLGTVVVNVRTLATGIELRDRVVRGQVLLSAQDEFEFGQFEPTSITDLPEQVTIGEPFTFQITGNLVLRGISNPVTFDASVTPVSETRLGGTASAVVAREDYGMEMPSVPGVADVEEEVELFIDFVATAA
jgi:polyisoprenoid-binding protein YceI